MAAYIWGSPIPSPIIRITFFIPGFLLLSAFFVAEQDTKKVPMKIMMRRLDSFFIMNGLIKRIFIHGAI
jgi:hypothetical protein